VTLTSATELAGTILEATGVAILFVGVLGAIVRAGYTGMRGCSESDLFEHTRRRLGRVLLLGLEVLVAGDIVRTVAIEPTFTGVGVLGAIVLIRIVLSWSIQMETEGRVPWKPRPDRPSVDASPAP
jgi:uncharacterized membrane protein